VGLIAGLYAIGTEKLLGHAGIIKYIEYPVVEMTNNMH
jgi:hypothetical protein